MWCLLCPKHLKSLLLAHKDRATISKIHAFTLSSGLLIHKSFINGLLIASYTKTGDISSARKLFDKLPRRGVSEYNSLIIAYSRQRSPNEVLGLYDEMVLEGVKPDSSTFTVAIKACVSLMDAETGKEIWRNAVDCGYGGDLFVGSCLLNLYVKCGEMDMATVVFDRMKRKDLVSWTTMVTGFVQSGQPVKAVGVYRRMHEEGTAGDLVLMVGLIQACADLGNTKAGLSVHGYMIRRDFCMDVVVETSLVDMYAKNGLLELASRVFDRMRHKNTLSWGALISGVAQNGFAGKTLELLIEMQIFGVHPDLVALVSALLACSQVGHLKLGKSLHSYILRRYDFSNVSATALIDMYSKCGALSSARTIFDQVDSRDLVCWNTMIASYGAHGLGQDALLVFLEMKETNSKPDHATFASLLSALSHSGLVQEGKKWFDLMVSEYKIQPTEKHYACAVDILARAGRVKEALDLIDSMDSEPGLAIWVAVLSGCCNYGSFDVGEIAAKKILEFNPDELGIHALVSNFFAMAKKWDKVASVRKIMKRAGNKKVPGHSVIEVNGQLHGFIMEDKTHHLYKDILNVLDKLDQEMREREYVSIIGT